MKMEIKIYIRPTDPWSKKLKTWLKRKKLSFQELDITESATYRTELIEKTSQMAVPVIDIDGKMIVGFHEDQILKAVTESKES
jgi:glutaredoxin 3